jgi:amino-acid N-acetyltransferase
MRHGNKNVFVTEDWPSNKIAWRVTQPNSRGEGKIPMGAPIRLREASVADLQIILGLLKSNSLCFEDVPQIVTSLYVGYTDSKLVGIGGVEVYGRVGLLRSVVIEEQYRGRGYGGALVSGIIENARKKGVRELYLLTTTAEHFFGRMGFKKTKRNAAPSEIQNTTEFKELCRDTSILMRKRI